MVTAVRNSYPKFAVLISLQVHTWGRPIGALIALALCVWASIVAFGGSLFGSPPLYSKGAVQRTLHFLAALIFAALAIYAAMTLRHA